MTSLFQTQWNWKKKSSLSVLKLEISRSKYNKKITLTHTWYSKYGSARTCQNVINCNNVNLTSSYKEAYYQLPICVITGCTMIPDLKFPEH